MSIVIEQVSKSFGTFDALREVSLEIPTGGLVALLGPSGGGKTTLLRIVAGLVLQDRGRVLFHGRDLSHVPARERRAGFVFQQYVLFRHMTVFDNIAFGLTVKPRRERPSKAAIAATVERLLALVQLEGLEARYPAQLSGGQRQRVALARALAIDPEVLLLDEPFGALDAKVRRSLRTWLRELHDKLHITSLFVTHDQEEALAVADTVVVVNWGRIEQIGTPDAIRNSPANSFVREFLSAA
jgi:sulfate transport system ATP-binding protein